MLPREDDAAAQCRAEMGTVRDGADELRRMLYAIDAQAGPETWSGPGGDRWRAEWSERRRAIEHALADVESQAPALIRNAWQRP